MVLSGGSIKTDGGSPVPNVHLIVNVRCSPGVTGRPDLGWALHLAKDIAILYQAPTNPLVPAIERIR